MPASMFHVELLISLLKFGIQLYNIELFWACANKHATKHTKRKSMEHNRFSPVVAISRYEIRYLRNSINFEAARAHCLCLWQRSPRFSDWWGWASQALKMCCEGVTPLNKEHLICYQSVWNWTVTKDATFN